MRDPVAEVEHFEGNDSSNETTLWVFNLRLDLESTVLAAAHDWVSEFAKNVKNVKVISTHIGSIDLPKNVTSLELGGGNTLARLNAILELMRLIRPLWRARKRSIVFHHMSPKTALILGIPIRMMRIPQGLWYSHAQNSKQFRISRRIVDIIFTSAPGTAPGAEKKYLYIGHGISEHRFPRSSIAWKKNSGEIICVGRVSPVKRLEDLLEAFPKIEDGSKNIFPRIVVCGEFDPHSDYFKALKSKSEQKKIEIDFVGPVTYSKINEFYARADFFFSGTQSSVDKAVIEAGLSGCLIISSNMAALKLTGMTTAWRESFGYLPSDMKSQFQALSTLTDVEKEKMREIVWETTLANNKLSNTINQILKSLEALRERKRI